MNNFNEANIIEIMTVEKWWCIRYNIVLIVHKL